MYVRVFHPSLRLTIQLAIRSPPDALIYLPLRREQLINKTQNIGRRHVFGRVAAFTSLVGPRLVFHRIGRRWGGGEVAAMRV